MHLNLENRAVKLILELVSSIRQGDGIKNPVFDELCSVLKELKVSCAQSNTLSKRLAFHLTGLVCYPWIDMDLYKDDRRKAIQKACVTIRALVDELLEYPGIETDTIEPQ